MIIIIYKEKSINIINKKLTVNFYKKVKNKFQL